MFVHREMVADCGVNGGHCVRTGEPGAVIGVSERRLWRRGQLGVLVAVEIVSRCLNFNSLRAVTRGTG